MTLSRLKFLTIMFLIIALWCSWQVAIEIGIWVPHSDSVFAMTYGVACSVLSWVAALGGLLQRPKALVAFGLMSQVVALFGAVYFLLVLALTAVHDPDRVLHTYWNTGVVVTSLYIIWYLSSKCLRIHVTVTQSSECERQTSVNQKSNG